jgi:hypothetical protein
LFHGQREKNAPHDHSQKRDAQPPWSAYGVVEERKYLPQDVDYRTKEPLKKVRYGVKQKDPFI